MRATYDPSVFDVASLKQAKAIILTPEGLGTEARWERETPWLADLAVQKLGLNPSSKVLDFGCGVGRLAQALIARTECRVFGWDISPNMRFLANCYVDSIRFRVLDEGVSFPVTDAAIAVWVLQHSEEPSADLKRIAASLRPGGRLFVVNNTFRAVPMILPTNARVWMDDKLPLERLLAEDFRELERGTLPAEFAVGGPDATYWALYEVR